MFWSPKTITKLTSLLPSMNVPTCKAFWEKKKHVKLATQMTGSPPLCVLAIISSPCHLWFLVYFIITYIHYISLHTSFVCIFSLPFTATSSDILLAFFTLFFLLMCLSVLPRLVSPGCHFPISSLCIYSSALLVSYQSFCFAASLPACIHVYPSVWVSPFGLI